MEPLTPTTYAHFDSDQSNVVTERIATEDNYVYQTIPTLDLSDQKAIEFSVKAKNDAHVLLTMGDNNGEEGMFEIVIGGWGNTKSMIRRAKQGEGIVERAGTINSGSEHVNFVLDWNTPRVLKLYRKSDASPPDLLMETPEQPDSDLNIKSMAVATGWGSTGDWTVQVPSHSRRVNCAT